MKFKHLKFGLYLLVMSSILVFSSCSEDEPTPSTPITVSITPNDVQLQPGDIFTISITVAADEGNDISVTLNDGNQDITIPNAVIGTFDYEYTYPTTAAADFSLTVTATDNTNSDATTNTATATALIGYVKGALKLADFGTLVRVGDQQIGDWWFDAPYSGALFGTGADTVILASRGGFSVDMDNGGFWDFDADLPETDESGVLMSREALKDSDPAKQDTAAWGGYMIPVFRAATPYDANEIASTTDGSRVVAVDVYYEDLDATHSFSALSAFRTDHENNDGAVKDKDGVKFQLRAINYDKWKQYPSWGADPERYFYVKEAYVTEANKWVTLYFNMDDSGDQGLDTGAASEMMASEIDGFWLIPNYGYTLIDRNKIYIKNLRITTEGF